ncbi:PepSY-associated TM helix domain-containing protein [Leptospira santarosai]|uniref:PepSY domain protein n=2 Tax=Leptospira santarosai TaxID=28183 RepID=M6V206_9LEPT|nr:PepSY-associated TM helix domain-containing protein [Leptospira santarosai]EMO47294.1 PepSY domain protein [Leptospira santarosai str. ZUN179]EMO57095.1 PepSY domain protein [Leptospira santarosai str. CBC1416]EMP82653.1 PepSY domain protein [Leptospira santarosai str. CBC1531]
MNRKRLYKLHSIFGLIAGGFLVVIGFTGSLLVFGHEIDRLLNPNLWYVKAEEERLSIDALREKLKQTLPSHALAGWLLSKKRNQPDQVWLHFLDSNRKKEFVILLNPYTGEILGKLAEDLSDSFYGWVLNLHYTLFMGSFGYVLTGIFGVIFVFQGISGMILYRNIWQNLFRLRTSQSLRTYFSDLHKLVGVFALIFNLVLGFTGAWWSARSTTRLLVRGFSEENKIGSFFNQSVSMNVLLKDATDRIPGFRLGFISFPHHQEKDPIQFYGTEEEQNPFRSPFGSYFIFDSDSGKMLQTFHLSNENLFYKIVDSFRPIHFGTFGGVFTKILWVILGLAPGILYLSGMGIFISKRNSKKRRPHYDRGALEKTSRS